VAVFVDGAFWHGHPDFFRFGQHGEYWDDKIRRTQARDAEQEAALAEAGYAILRLWDFDVAKDPHACAMKIGALLAEAGSPVAQAITLTKGAASRPDRIVAR
jgi:DNA mismatch endonuclease (patch repair protein)